MRLPSFPWLVLFVACGGDPATASDASVNDASLVDTTAPVDASSPDVTADADAARVRPTPCNPALPAPTPGTQTARPKGTTCAKLGYLEYVPPGYKSSSNWPLILFFHGNDQRGDGSPAQLATLTAAGLPKDIPISKWDPQKRFVVLSPQMDDRNGLTERDAPSVKAFLDFALGNYDVDLHRVYLTGLSGGAVPIYNYLAAYGGGDVAAVAPTSGLYASPGKECTWKSVPIWYFHGAIDTDVVPTSNATLSYQTLAACSPAAPVAPRYTLFKDVGHWSWDPTYELSGMNAQFYPLVAPGTTPYDVSIYDWFLKYSR